MGAVHTSSSSSSSISSRTMMRFVWLCIAIAATPRVASFQSSRSRSRSSHSPTWATTTPTGGAIRHGSSSDRPNMKPPLFQSSSSSSTMNGVRRSSLVLSAPPRTVAHRQRLASSLNAEAAAAAPSDSNTNSEQEVKPMGGGTATIPNEVFNLVKSIVGAGVLTLPSGIAAYGNAPSAVLPAIVLIATFGVLSGYGFALIGRVCAMTQTTSYKAAWEATVDASSSWIPAVSVTCKTIFAALAYSMILGDTFCSLAAGWLPPTVILSKPVVLGSVTTLLLLPLCLLKNLSSLAPFSLLGSLGMMYTAGAMAFRYATGAYSTTAAATTTSLASSFAKDLPMALRPSFGTQGAASVFTPVTAILLGMLSTAYMAHFNAPKFYTELKNNTVPRYLTVVSTSFGVSMTLFALIASLGFLTFGGNSSGLILNNYSTRDSLMSLSRLAVAVSLVFSYPLAFAGARDGILDLFAVKNRSTTRLNVLTVGLLASITVAALVIPDVSFVLAFAGATLGNALIYIFPGLMFRGAIQKLKNPTRLQKAEVKLALSSAVLGSVLGLLGAWKAVQSIL